jgi:phosphohistidine phosphatase
MIFGHNPTLTLTHNYLCDKRIDNIPTCALAAIEFYTDSWERIEIGSGRNFLFEYPKKYL